MQGARGICLLSHPTDYSICKISTDGSADMHLPSKEEWQDSLVIKKHEIDLCGCFCNSKKGGSRYIFSQVVDLQESLSQTTGCSML